MQELILPSRRWPSWMVVTVIMTSCAIIALAAVALIMGKDALITMVLIVFLILGFFSYVNL